MKTNTSDKIIEYISEKGQATAKDMVDYLNISRQALFQHLSKLLANGQIYKVGRPSKVFYYIKEKE